MQKESKEGAVCVTYRPLQGLDQLQFGLLSVLSQQQVSLQFTAKVFSLAVSVIKKELATLESLGLISTDPLSLSVRGERCVFFREQFGGHFQKKIQTDSQQWKLGHGEFSIDEHFRDGNEVSSLPSKHGVSDDTRLLEFILEFDRSQKEVISFLQTFQSNTPVATNCQNLVEEIPKTTKAFVKQMQQVACNKTLSRLISKLESFLESVVSMSAALRPSIQASEFESIHAEMQAVRNAIKKNVGACRRSSQKLREKKAACDAYLIRSWMERIGFKEEFDREPAAFQFSSSIALPEPPPRIEKPSRGKHTPSRQEGFNWGFAAAICALLVVIGLYCFAPVVFWILIVLIVVLAFLTAQ